MKKKGYRFRHCEGRNFGPKQSKAKHGFTLTELAVVFIIIITCILLLTPFINNIRSKEHIAECMENLVEISLALNLYASEHQEKFPESLAELVEGGYLEDEGIFDCPSSKQIGDAQEPDYHYTSGYAIADPSDTVLVFDKAGNHKTGKHVLYLSGDIIWEAK